VLQEYHGSLDRLFAGPWQITRQELLAVKGIGPETADSILLYAGQKPSFVVDAYTRRIFSRLGLVDEQISYDRLRDFFMDRLPQDTTLFNEYHALIVELGKQACRPKPNATPVVWQQAASTAPVTPVSWFRNTFILISWRCRARQRSALSAAEYVCEPPWGSHRLRCRPSW
jgi:endonuclease III related protein